MAEICSTHNCTNLKCGRSERCEKCKGYWSACRASVSNAKNRVSDSKSHAFMRTKNARGLEHTITTKWLFDIVVKQNFKCPISGLTYDYSKGTGKQSRNPKRISLDRINHTIGYIPSNIRVCSSLCNTNGIFTRKHAKEIAKEILKLSLIHI